MFDKHKEHLVGHEPAVPKPVTMAEWAEKNEVDLKPVSHVLNGVVADIESLDAMIQSIPTAPDEKADVGYGSVENKKRLDIAGPVSPSDRQKLQDEVQRPYAPADAALGGTALLQHIQAIQQTSRNLRTKVQVLKVTA
jgi:hypothetical protein